MTARVLKGATVVPMDRPETDAAVRVDVAIEDGRITRMEPDIQAGPADEAVDLTGKYLLPGLIDVHCHLTYSGGLVEQELRLTPAQRMVRTVRNAYDTLLAGITTIRDTGGIGHMDIAIRDAIRKRIVHGPEVVACGRMIAITGGHGWFYGLEADGPDAVRKAVREQVKARCDWVKFMASGGFAEEGEEPDAAQLDFDELQAGIREAHRAGRRTAAHAHSAVSIHHVVRAGIDTIEHCSFMDDEAIDLILERDIYIVPTFSIYYKMMMYGLERGLQPSVVEMVKKYWDRKVERFLAARRAGVKVGVGTDNGSPIARHGDIVTELEILVQTGMTPYQALHAATAGNARLLGCEEQIGTIEVGKRADLVVLGADPLLDVGAVRKVEAVFKNGALYRRDSGAGVVTVPDLPLGEL